MKIIRLLLLVLFFSGPVAGLNLKIPLSQSMHTAWTTKNGLPSDSISDIIQDRAGYIWIGTYNGLARFDGINFTNFSRYQDQGFQSNSVTALLEGKDGAIWIGTNGEGMARFRDGLFTMFNDHLLKDRVIKSLSMDPEGRLWIGTGNGLLVYTADGGFKTPFNGRLNDQAIETLYHDPDGTIWIGSGSGGLITGSSHQIRVYEDLNEGGGPVVTSVLKTGDGELWVGTRSNGLFRTGKGARLVQSRLNGLNIKTITTLRQGTNGCVWIGTDSGLFRFSEEKFHRYCEEDGLSNNQVSEILEDKEGSLWIATTRGGINKLSDGKFVSITTLQGLVNNKVNVIFQEADDIFWMGTDGGLSIYQNGQFLQTKLTEFLKDIRIRHIRGDSRERIWISTYSDYGLIKFDRKNIETITTRQGLSSNRCRVSLEDHRGNIWVGTSNGLNLLREKNQIRIFHRENGLSDNYVLSLFEDKEKRIWITTNGGGISIFDNGRFTWLTAREGLSSNVVFRIHQDSAGIYWISTSRGISRYDGSSVYNFTDQNGIPEHAVFQILEDGRNRLWMITEKGIHIADKQSLNQIAEKRGGTVNITLYNDLDGLLDSPTPVSWAIRTRQGKNMFATLMGVASIDTLNIPINEKPPPLLIEMIRVDNRNYSPPQLKVLSPNYKRLTFAYTALSYVIPHKVQYTYKLEGFEEDWSPLTTRREISYTTLPPGDYTFRVRAVNNDGVWNNGDISVPFSQKPFFYQTLWFFIVTILSLIGILALLLGVRIRSLRKRGRELEKIVAERTAELRTTDRIVADINKEIRIDKLLKVLLQQTMSLFPQAEKGVILTYNQTIQRFVHQVSRGYEDITTSGIQLTFDHAFDRYVRRGEEFEKGIYVHRRFTDRVRTGVTPKIDIPESMIAMTIVIEDTIDGFFILENMKDAEAFTRADAVKLMRVREHAISAVFKARTHQKLEEAAIKDPLTGLNNRRKMIEVMESEQVRSRRKGQLFCIVMCDIDHFKKFNDTYGHDCGDSVLVEVSGLIRSSIRKQDVVGRWGGEEFLMVYPETDLEGGITVTEKVRSAVEDAEFVFNETKLKITMTFGVALHDPVRSIDDAIKKADDALYIGKKRGRNCVIPG